MKLHSSFSLLMGALLLLVTQISGAGDMLVQTSKSVTNAPPSFSANDLAQTHYLESSATGPDEIATLHALMFDGVIGDGSSGTGGPGIRMYSANTFTVTFDTSENSNGFNITQIDSIFGWNIPSNGRSNQGFEILLAFVDGTTNTLAGPAHWEPNSPAEFWTKVSFVMDGGGILDSATVVTNGVAFAGSGVRATGVRAVTFNITEDANAGGVVVGREVDIFGVPSLTGTILVVR